jgi:hypothetical protein
MVVRKLVVGPEATDDIGIDLEAPTLIYSRPKGTYAGKDAEMCYWTFLCLIPNYLKTEAKCEPPSTVRSS